MVMKMGRDVTNRVQANSYKYTEHITVMRDLL